MGTQMTRIQRIHADLSSGSSAMIRSIRVIRVPIKRILATVA